jgi:hypothetical protein
MSGLKSDNKQLQKISKDLRFIEIDFGYTLSLLTIDVLQKNKLFYLGNPF